MLLLKSGWVVCPSSNLNEKLDILIDDQGKISALAPQLEVDGAEVFNAEGLTVVPGLIDLHTHLREPGGEAQETIKTGTRAAAAGGYTTVACMGNTNPKLDNPLVIRYLQQRIKEDALVNVFIYGCITKGQEGKELTEMASLLAEGVVGFSDDGRSVASNAVMRRAMLYGRQFDALFSLHCEDEEICKGGAANDGYAATVLGIPGMPAIGEELIVARDLLLAEETGVRVHIAHLSTAGSVRLVREAKKRGVRVTAEVCPHHICLTEDAIMGYNTMAKVNPPLRTQADIDSIIAGLQDGTIDAIATDHAPHTSIDKAKDFVHAPFGISGLETAFSLAYTALVKTNCLTLPALITKMSLNPAKILGLKNKGRIALGADGDLTLIDLNKETIINPDNFESKGKNSPFAGKSVVGFPVVTIVGGKIIMKYDSTLDQRQFYK
ncbi:MAG TPA: dihydroorotase [Clostridia bacterium]|jgi:dihydroorotase|nr:dihydroorotase [Clostridia bacterium]